MSLNLIPEYLFVLLTHNVHFRACYTEAIVFTQLTHIRTLKTVLQTDVGPDISARSPSFPIPLTG